MTLLGGRFTFPDGAVLSLMGSDFGATLDGRPVESWTAVEVKPGQALRVGPTRSGARCYLCVQGGIVVKDFLGSASTHLLSGLGGYDGRALRKGDVLKIGSSDGRTGILACSSPSSNPSGALLGRRVAPKVLQRLAPRKVLRVTPGPQSDSFSEEAKRLFYASTYRVAEESNRMGIRLQGAAIQAPASGEMISEGVALGAVQGPDSGLPIVLFVEPPTTAGYPKIPNVLSADMPSLG